jgi:predicted SnoaL-like aldol condensation-catalyzing enzyme
MSTEQNKAIVSRIWQEIFNEGNLDLIDQLYDPSYLYHGPGGKELKGLEDLRQYTRQLRTLMPDVHFSLDDIIAEGDKVAVRWTMTATYEPQNIQVTNTGMIISSIVDGKCVEDWEIFDRLWMAEQGTTGWIKKRILGTITKEMKKALPFLAHSA